MKLTSKELIERFIYCRSFLCWPWELPYRIKLHRMSACELIEELNRVLDLDESRDERS